MQHQCRRDLSVVAGGAKPNVRNICSSAIQNMLLLYSPESWRLDHIIQTISQTTPLLGISAKPCLNAGEGEAVLVAGVEEEVGQRASDSVFVFGNILCVRNVLEDFETN